MIYIYHFFERHKLYIPIVYYNEPCLIADTRTDHWLIQINYKQNYYLKLEKTTQNITNKPIDYFIEIGITPKSFSNKEIYTLENINDRDVE